MNAAPVSSCSHCPVELEEVDTLVRLCGVSRTDRQAQEAITSGDDHTGPAGSFNRPLHQDPGMNIPWGQFKPSAPLVDMEL